MPFTEKLLDLPPTIREICRFLSQLPFKHFTPAAARSKRISCIFS
ncbi:hypothetical protein B4099_0032 [Heyndrickxia coagulans]|uniref:Uncharacterized protein n=1 Tax=Heyndrickxia coagulans TaxID=1398 RepID=A0A150KA76_HEYCO|nr:hypothetical protein B4099_0032 [Heyndrickxia coagulans]